MKKAKEKRHQRYASAVGILSGVLMIVYGFQDVRWWSVLVCTSLGLIAIKTGHAFWKESNIQ